GQIDLMMDVVGNALLLIRDGRLKGLAVTTEKRISDLPDMPTVSEALPGLIHTEWFAMVAPPKTPPAIVGSVWQAIAETLRRPDVVQRLRDFSTNPGGSSPEETAALIKQESERWRRVIASTGIKSE